MRFSIPIETRRLRFKINKELDRDWNNRDPVLSHLFNAISILAPAFERLAIASVLPYRDKMNDPILRQQLLGFIGQESAHGSEFIRFNQVLRTQGYPTKALEKENLTQFKLLADKLSPIMHLSLTLAAEHMTAIISDLILREDHWLEQAPAECRALWRWHAIEEIEHKAVAYDVFTVMKGGYVRRIIGMMIMLVMIPWLLSKNYFYLAKTDNLLNQRSFWIRSVCLFWGKKGFFRKLMGPLLGYFLPHFHPWKKNNFNLIAKWKKLFEQAQNQEECIKGLYSKERCHE